MHGGQYADQCGAPVRFHGKKDELDGAYTLVVWENKTAPILRGREQTTASEGLRGYWICTS